MKRLVLGMAACAVAQGLLADPENLNAKTWSSDTDISSTGGTTREYVMTADLTAPVQAITTAFGSTCVMDMGGYTLYPATAKRENFQFYFAQKSGDKGPNYATLKNGTVDGSKITASSNHGFRAGGNNVSTCVGNATLDNVKLVNFNYFRIGFDETDSTTTFKNGTEVDARNLVSHFELFTESSTCGYNNIVSFESGSTLTMNEDLTTDDTSLSGAVDYNCKLRFTGAGTKAYIDGNVNISRTMTGFTLEVLDGAVFESTKWMGYGTAQAKNGTVLVDNATLKCGRIVMGNASGSTGHKIIAKNGAKLQLSDGIAIGNQSSDNTLIVSNADLTALSGIGLGGYNKSRTSGCLKNNKAYFVGQSTVFKGWPLVDTGFYGANNLVCFDNCTLDASNTGYSFDVYNPNPDGSGTDLWENNEISIINGATVSLASFVVGDHSKDSLPICNQTLTVGNDATLNIAGSMFVGHIGNTVVVSNGTINVGASNPDYAEFDIGLRGGGATHVIDGNVLEFHGDRSQVSISGTDTIMAIMNGTILRFYLPEGGEYQKAPISTPKVWLREYVAATDTTPEGKATTFEFPNLAEIQKTIVGTKAMTLIHTTTALNCPDVIISDANAKLPAGCKLSKANGDIVLTVTGLGFSYDAAFTSIADYNAAVTGENAANYKDKDVYVVINKFDFQAGVDYSLAGQTNVKLHLFFYNCTFPSENGTMNPEGPSSDLTASNRKMIAVVAMKELWVEGCTFNYYQGDSYVIDVNTSNSYDPDGCGVTIKNNTFKSGAGKRVPLSMKNKTATPLAFCLIEGNTFGACAGDISDTKDVTENDTYAGVICFGDQSTSTTTAGGANFPITIQNNTFADGVTQYVVMSGMYVSSGKQGLDVPVGTSYTWAYDSEAKKWVSTPAFPKYDGEVSYDVAADGTCTIKGKGALTASTIEKIGKSNLTKLVLGADFTSVDANVFAKCYGLTEVTFQGQVTLGDGAFLRCNSLEKMNFAAMPTLGKDSIVMQAAIFMKDGMPSVYAIPEITVTGYSTVLVGKVNLTDAEWTVVTDETKKDYHFFKLVLEKNK